MHLKAIGFSDDVCAKLVTLTNRDDKNTRHRCSPDGCLRRAVQSMRQRGLTSVLDLGSGGGYSVAVFAAAGFASYGVEIDPDMVTSSREKLARCKDLFAIPPIIVQADYFDPAFATLSLGCDMTPATLEAFFCYPYDRDHAKEILGSLHYARSGSLVLIDELGLSRSHCTPERFSWVESADPEWHWLQKM